MPIRALALAAIMLSGASAAHAALAPNFQRANELTAIIGAVAEAVPKYPIDKIIKQGRDRYAVIAGECTIIARIVGLPAKPGLVGPKQFKVELERPRCD